MDAFELLDSYAYELIIVRFDIWLWMNLKFYIVTWSVAWCILKLLDELNYEFTSENSERRKSWGALPGSQHFRVEGRAKAPRWDQNER